MIKRYAELVDIVNKYKRIEVSKLAEMLDVSQVTIRKDLKKLEDKGLLSREHGFAIMSSSDDIRSRLTYNYDTKLKIAKKAAEMVKDGETLMIESGSSCVLLAEEIAKNRNNITIITNSFFIADYIKKLNVKIVLLGGDYQEESQVTVGPLTTMCARTFHVNKLFIGTDGYDKDTGFTGKDLQRTETVKAMAESADNIVILTDSSKFSRRGVVSQFKPEEVSFVFTDKEIPKDISEDLEKKDVKLVTI
ncbi:DeoR/GlpR family DNA-binding transcription regulator [Clostridium sp. BJN0001]|uniref:DeoR/GlpR family DNA-binding transcription regulator n=1 Tax=Clostridium sp. BJN0001 TaxID=2930219 RepID=UPI001FD027F5|nr:DeoR/GlpR family DNA-binding transcription regulator [Clostridium sp. BJN0001]